MNGVLAQPIPMSKQKKALFGLEHVLDELGCQLEDGEETVQACFKHQKRNITVYPAMWNKPVADSTIFVNEMELRYAKPFAVEKILKSF